MLRNYSAVDLRGVKCEYFDTVVSLPGIDGDLKGAMLQPDQIGRAKKILSGREHDVVFGMGRDLDTNRKIVESSFVDILSRPYPIDDTIAKMAQRNDKCFEVCARDIINAKGFFRARMIQSLSRTIDLANKRGVDIVITSGATDLMELVAPRELVAFGVVLGMTFPQAKGAISTIPRRMLEGRGLL